MVRRSKYGLLWDLHGCLVVVLNEKPWRVIANKSKLCTLFILLFD